MTTEYPKIINPTEKCKHTTVVFIEPKRFLQALKKLGHLRKIVQHPSVFVKEGRENANIKQLG